MQAYRPIVAKQSAELEERSATGQFAFRIPGVTRKVFCMDETQQLAAELRAKALHRIWTGAAWTSLPDLACLSKVDTSEVERWLRDRLLFALVRDGQLWVPGYAIGSDYKPLPVIAAVLKTFAGDRSDEAVAAWFESTSSFLVGGRPRELTQSEPDLVVVAAEDSMNAIRYS